MEIICGDIYIKLGVVKGEKVIKLVKPVEEKLSVVDAGIGCVLLGGPTVTVLVDPDNLLVTSKNAFEAIASSPVAPETFTRLRDFLNA